MAVYLTQPTRNNTRARFQSTALRGNHDDETNRPFLSSARWHCARRARLVVREHRGDRSPVSGEDLGREQDVSHGTVGEARRDGPGNGTARVLQPGTGGIWIHDRHL